MNELVSLLPILIIGLGAVFVMLLGAFTTLSIRKLARITRTIIIIALAITLPSLFGDQFSYYIYPEIFHNMLISDSFGLLFNMLFLLGALLSIYIGNVYIAKNKFFTSETFALILFSLFGMMLLSMATEMITAFIALEIASLSIYVLVGLNRKSHKSSEAVFKYLLLGSFGGSFFLMGTAFIYAQTGTTQLGDIASFISLNIEKDMTLVIVGGTLVMMTLMFKISAVPFQAWTLDVYDGASLPVTAYMASTFKIAIFAIALRIFLVDFQLIQDIWDQLLMIITIITLIVGSLLAVIQTNIKRMLAASSMVHSGYLLIALASTGISGTSAAPSIIFYLIAYFLSAIGAFGLLSYVSWDTRRRATYEDFKGFAHMHPYLALMMTIFMLSFAGFPSTIGFLGKFYIFTGAIEAGYTVLAILGVLSAFVSIYYYFRLIIVMYFYPSQHDAIQLTSRVTPIVIGLIAITVLWGGIGTSLISFLPGANGFIEFAQNSVASLFISH